MECLGNVDIDSAAWPLHDEQAPSKTKNLLSSSKWQAQSKLTVSADATKEQVEEIGLSDENVAKFTDGKTIRKVIYVPRKLLNIVAN